LPEECIDNNLLTRYMEKFTGIWVDHKKAVIISISGTTEEKQIILSDLEPRRRIAGEGKQYTRMGHAFIDPEHRQEERIRHQLDRYYQAVCKYVQDASDILIFGPGEAKLELKKSIEKQKALEEKNRQVETADRLTENQIAARVREFAAKIRFFNNPLANPYNK
jgi:hypothetical protein